MPVPRIICDEHARRPAAGFSMSCATASVAAALLDGLEQRRSWRDRAGGGNRAETKTGGSSLQLLWQRPDRDEVQLAQAAAAQAHARHRQAGGGAPGGGNAARGGGGGGGGGRGGAEENEGAATLRGGGQQRRAILRRRGGRRSGCWRFRGERGLSTDCPRTCLATPRDCEALQQQCAPVARVHEGFRV